MPQSDKFAFRVVVGRWPSRSGPTLGRRTQHHGVGLSLSSAAIERSPEMMGAGHVVVAVGMGGGWQVEALIEILGD